MIVSMLAVVLVGEPILGQAKKKAAPPTVTKKKPRGRLPAYYAGVVDEKQRERIYAIQKQYAGQIESLQKQIASTRMKRDQAIERVLTKSQLSEIRKKRAAAAAKRKARTRSSTRKKGTETTPKKTP